VHEVPAGIVLRVTRPCALRWDDLQGTSARRDCAACDTAVHNLDAMTSAQIRGLIAASPRGFCGKYATRPGEPFVVPAERDPGAATPTAATALLLVATLVGCSGEEPKSASRGLDSHVAAGSWADLNRTSVVTPRPTATPPTITKEQCEELAALGYIDCSGIASGRERK
jgi:hypothetical protein